MKKPSKTTYSINLTYLEIYNLLQALNFAINGKEIGGHPQEAQRIKRLFNKIRNNAQREPNSRAGDIIS